MSVGGLPFSPPLSVQLQLGESTWLQGASVPPLLPEHVQVSVVPSDDVAVALAVPALHVPAADAHTPLIGSDVLQLAVVPPLLPAQVQVVVVPSLEVALAVPAVQAPAADAHTPFVGLEELGTSEGKQLGGCPAAPFISHSFGGKGAKPANAFEHTDIIKKESPTRRKKRRKMNIGQPLLCV
jgi:hypothetical protein